MPIEFDSFSIGAVAGGIIVGIANHFLTKTRDSASRKTKEFNDACKNIITAFSPELAALKSPSSENPPDPYNVLFEAFDKHRIAVTEFSNFLSGSAKKQFEASWQKYYAYDDDDEPVDQRVKGELPHEYLIKYGPGWENIPEKECRKRAIRNIEQILSFARHK